MECQTPVDDTCDVWQPDDFNSSDVSVGQFDEYQIEIYTNFTNLLIDELEEGCDSDEDDRDFLRTDRMIIDDTFRQFRLRCDRRPSNNLSWSAISHMLTTAGVPLHKQPFMLHRISSVADEIANADRNRNRKILPMRVQINVVVDYPREVSDDMEAEEVSGEAARKEDVEGLEKVRINISKDCSDQVNECTICLERFEQGCEVTKMPCSHVFHGNCLGGWLLINGVCPVCRFKLGH